nr:unnamed protein product [Callosobruchus analis]
MFLNVLGIPFFITTKWLGEWIFGHFACKVYTISTSIGQTGSILLCITNADRFLAVYYPISYPTWRMPRTSKIVSLLAWTLGIILIAPISESSFAGTVIGTYVICYLPYWIAQLALEGHNDSLSITLHLLASCVSFVHPSVNPLLHAFMNENFKESMMLHLEDSGVRRLV